jgi:selenocysteine-specific translation elongation factor
LLNLLNWKAGSERMKSLTISVLSDDAAKRAEVCRALGKRSGAEEDVNFYHSKLGDALLTVLDPARYPEKVQALLQSVAISDYCVLAIDKLSPAVGEIIVALDCSGKKDGCIFTSLHPSQLEPFLKGTCLSDWTVYPELEKVREASVSFSPGERAGPARGIIDHSFEVKGVGSVALGFVARGKLAVFPSGKNIEIRSIQMQDDDYDSASAGDRFGISFKGCAAAELSRGDVIAPAGSLQSRKEIEIEAELSRFSKKGLNDGDAFHGAVGLQFVPCRVAGSIPAGGKGRIKLVFDAPVAVDPGERILIVRLNEKPLRVSGFGTA